MKMSLDSSYVNPNTTPLLYKKIWSLHELEPGEYFVILYSNNSRLGNVVYSHKANSYAAMENPMSVLANVNIISTLVGDFRIELVAR
jgi:hypothetical protein